jgi:hypothetical protein
MGYAWTPVLDDVGGLIPYRTRTANPDNPGEAGTFTPDTTPPAERAQGFIDDAVYAVISMVGEIPAYPAVPVPVAQLLGGAAKTAAAYQAAADIELAYPQRPGDVQIWTQLDKRAAEAMTALKAAMEQTGSGTIEAFPIGNFPQPEDLKNEVLATNPYLIFTD